MTQVMVAKPAACPTCGGDGVVGIVPDARIGTLAYCPDCRCICGCGRDVGMPGLADDCWAADWVRADTAHRRAAGR